MYFFVELATPIQRRLPLVAIFLSFRVLWGRGFIRPPGCAKVVQTPGRARVKPVNIADILLYCSPKRKYCFQHIIYDRHNSQ